MELVDVLIGPNGYMVVTVIEDTGKTVYVSKILDEIILELEEDNK